jgi:hypothetical protein
MALGLGVTDKAIIYINDSQFSVRIKEADSEFATDEITLRDDTTGKSFLLGYDETTVYPEVTAFLPLNEHQTHKKICFNAPRRIQIDRYEVYGDKKIYGDKNTAS